MKKILLLGGGYADIPLIKAAQDLGYYVITTGNNPTELGHQHSNEYIYGDFSDKAKMLEIARSNRVDAVCSCCNDFSAISAAFVADAMGLPGHDSYQVALTIHHKDRFRSFARKMKLSSPYAESFTESESALLGVENLELPLIVKPVDLTGGKGVSVINSLVEAKQVVEQAFSISKVKRVVIEEFIDGSRHGLSMIIESGKVVFSFFDDEYYYKNPYMVFGTTSPGTLDQSIIDQLLKESELIANSLGLKNGIFHMQFILRNNKPYIIEICRRAPGDLYTKFVEHATGVDYAKLIVSAQVSEKIQNINTLLKPRYTARFCIMSPHNGTLESVTFSDELETNLVERVEWWEKGQKINNYMTAKLGIIFLEFASLSDMNKKVNEMENHIRVIMQ